MSETDEVEEKVAEKIAEKATKDEETKEAIKEAIKSLSKKKEPALEKVKKILGIEVEPVKVNLNNEAYSNIIAQAMQLESLRALRSSTDEEDDFARKLAREVALIRAVSSSGNEETSELKKEIEALKQRLEEEREKRMIESISSALAQKVDELTKLYDQRFAELQAQISSLQPKEPKESNTASKITEIAKMIEEMKQAFSSIGIKVVTPSEAPPTSIEEMKAYLEKSGFEVKPLSISKEELEKMLKEREEKLKEELEREYREKYDKEKLAKITEIITNFFNTVGLKLAEAPVEEKRLKLAQEIAKFKNLTETGAQQVEST
ncbi:MAG: hypothetical protein JTT12_05600 [Candidatus Brockarchaeota archaeon]|nr:hypothetical protein [Candidatus Brockarchaeota archaeon]